MPKKYFSYIPTVEYDVDSSGVQLLAINILKRIKVKAAAISDGSVFYNYQYQDGDTPEIIADKYYGYAQYHWVVMLMNNAAHYVYDFPLNSDNFDKYIKDKYGSIERAEGVTKTISNRTLYANSGIYGEWQSEEQTNYNDPNLISSGSIPKGNSTAIYVESSKNSDPFSNIGVGDVVRIFVPEGWYDLTSNNSTKLSYTQPAKVIAKSVRRNVSDVSTKRKYYLNTNMNSNSYVSFTWIEPDANTAGETITIQTGIHHFEMDVYDSTGEYQLANNVHISQNQYVNNSIGTSPFYTKRIISNHTFEIDQNEKKRNIFLLKKEYLNQFLEEFENITRRLG